jgi:uncharacterized protein DUF6328
LYLATLLLTLLACVLLMAPVLVHRLHFRRGEKGYIVEIGNRLVIAGLVVLALAMTSAVALVTHFLFGPATAIVTTVIVAAAIVLAWFVLPLRRRHLFVN